MTRFTASKMFGYEDLVFENRGVTYPHEGLALTGTASRNSIIMIQCCLNIIAQAAENRFSAELGRKPILCRLADKVYILLVYAMFKLCST